MMGYDILTLITFVNIYETLEWLEHQELIRYNLIEIEYYLLSTEEITVSEDVMTFRKKYHSIFKNFK